MSQAERKWGCRELTHLILRHTAPEGPGGICIQVQWCHTQVFLSVPPTEVHYAMTSFVRMKPFLASGAFLLYFQKKWHEERVSLSQHELYLHSSEDVKNSIFSTKSFVCELFYAYNWNFSTIAPEPVPSSGSTAQATYVSHICNDNVLVVQLKKQKGTRWH